MPSQPLVFDSRGPNANRAYIALALGLIGWISASRAVDAVLVKGAAAELTGLRPAYNFGDVDIVVRPAELEVFRGELAQRGWLSRPFEDKDDVFPKHSISMYHPQWPIDIDIHYRFPGFEAATEDIIDEIRKDALLLRTGELPLEIPSRLGCIVFQALHQLRSPWEAGSPAALAELHRRSADISADQFLDFARRTDCLAALRPFLEQRPDFPADGISFPAPSAEWRLRTLGQDSASIRIFTLLRAPWWKKPKLAWKAVFPSRTALAAKDIAISERKPPLPRIHAQRILRFGRNLPKTIRSVRQLLATERQIERTRRGLSRPAPERSDFNAD